MVLNQIHIMNIKYKLLKMVTQMALQTSVSAITECSMLAKILSITWYSTTECKKLHLKRLANR